MSRPGQPEAGPNEDSRDRLALQEALKEALEQQSAVAEILRSISESPADVQPVFEAVADAALRLTGADVVAIWRAEPDRLVVVSERRHPAVSTGSSGPLDRSFVSAVAYMERRTVHVPDVRDRPELVQGEPLSRLAVPITTPTGAFGTLFVAYMEARPFTQRQIELVETFAHQAAIAIENVRLFTETKEALERQTATAEILEVISRSPDSLDPVLQAIAERAVALCQGQSASVALRTDDDTFVGRATAADTPEAREFLRLYSENLAKRVGPIRAGDRATLAGRVALERKTLQVEDMTKDPDFFNILPPGLDREELPYRAIVGVPMLRGEELIGVLLVRRREPRLFGDAQVRLLETFAAQAVIAMENVRLFNETKEALEQQTATREVLEAISAAALDLDRVFATIVENSVRLCRAANASLNVAGPDGFQQLAHYPPKELDWYLAAVRGHVTTAGRGSIGGRVLLEGRTVQIEDVHSDPEYDQGFLERMSAARVQATGRPGVPTRTMLGVPIKKGERILGIILARRNEVRRFDDREVEILETFANQAAIAIENVRSRETVERQREELRRFLSPQVADLITSPEGQALLTGHRREITVVFCDLRGFTAFSETAEPEEALAVVRTFHATLGPLVFEHGGTLEHFEGDGAMIFFNDPVQVEDHVLRAVRMTLAMRERMADHVAAWRKRGHELGFGCGIATGYATLGRIGFEGRYDYGAIGPVTNLASRLASEAKAGQILLSQRAFAQIEERVDVEPIGEITVKGYSRPQAAYNVGRLKEPVPA